MSNSAHGYSEGSEDNWSWMTYEKALRLSKPILDCESTKQMFDIAMNVVKKADAKLKRKDEEIQQLKAALKWALNSLSSYYDDPSSETFDKYNNARNLIEFNKPEK